MLQTSNCCGCPNRNSCNGPHLAKPLFHKGDLTQRKIVEHSEIRVYHRKLRTDNLINIYGADAVDRSMGNVSLMTVLPLDENQKKLYGID